MKTLIVGAGASGLVLGLQLKLKNKDEEVIIIDKNNKVGKKLLVTGNGKCNLGNSGSINNRYRNNDFTKVVLDDYGFKYQQQFFAKLGIKTKLMGELCYPYSESAKSFVDYLYELALSLGIKFFFEEEVVDYVNEKEICVKTNKANYLVNRLIITSGGKSYPKFGSDGGVFKILVKHGYTITDLYPGLCPIKTKEKTKDISGNRLKVLVRLSLDNQTPYEELGEVLFKDDGLSGIAIFNVSSFIARNIGSFKSAFIKLDLFPQTKEEDLYLEFKRITSLPQNVLNGYFNKEVVNYLMRRVKDDKSNADELRKITQICKNLEFEYLDLYDFANAQVTVGGLSLTCINNDLSSKMENNIYFAGEILDNDGLCGGYNLMWAFGTALYLGETLCK